MRRTLAHSDHLDSTVPQRAFGHSREAGDEWRRDDQSLTSATLGDGGVYTSIDDMLIWERMWLHGSSAALPLPASTVAQIFTVGRLSTGEVIEYGDVYAGQLYAYRSCGRWNNSASPLPRTVGIMQ